MIIPCGLPGPGGMTTTRLPTVITQTEQGKPLLGQLAKRQAVLQPEHTAYALKRLLGRKFGSQAVRRIAEMVSYHPSSRVARKCASRCAARAIRSMSCTPPC